MKITAILMAGGKNSRFDFSKTSFKFKEKLLLPLGNQNIIDYSIKAALNAKTISKLIIASSPQARSTYDFIKQKYPQIQLCETEGKGYLQDIHSIIQKLGLELVLTMVGDNPFITSQILDFIVNKFSTLRFSALSVMIPVKSYQKLRLKVPSEFYFFKDGEKLISAGFNILDGRLINQQKINQFNLVLDDVRLMYNINTFDDYNQSIEFYESIIKKEISM